MTPSKAARTGPQKLAWAVFLAAYFLYFSWRGLFADFASDDMMNMDAFWALPPWRLMLSQLQIWQGGLRPMGGLFYMPLYYAFGLNPLPYHVAMSAILMVNVYWMYRFARGIGCEELVAGLAALAACYHVGMSNLYYDTAFIYDVLCFFFSLAAFVFYARIRARDRLLRGWETAVFVALYVCALNSKEMAVTLPVVLLAYEWFCRKAPRFRGGDLARWLGGPGRVALIAAGLNVLYLYGKLIAPNAMADQPGYRPALGWQRFLDFQNRELNNLFLGWHGTGWRGVLAIWILLAYLAFRRAHGKPRPELRFCLIFIAVTPLPIEFLDARGGACLYLPLAGWAVIAATVFLDVARAVAGFLADEPLFRHAGRRALTAILMAAGVWFWTGKNQRRMVFINREIAGVGGQTTGVIAQFKALHPSVPPGSQVVFLNDPFAEWDMAFIADLCLHDRSIKVRLQRKAPLRPEELARMRAVFDYRDGRLVQVR